MNESDKTAAPSAVAKIKEWERPRNGYKAMIDYDALYVEALDLAKRLDATLAAVSIVRGEGTPSDRDCVDEIVTLQQRAERAEAARDWYISETKNGIEIIREKEAALKRAQELLREAIPQLIGETERPTPRYPAAFINAIAEEGTKAEAVEWLQRTWDARCELARDRADLMEALRALREKMKELDKELIGVFTLFAVHGGRWPEDKNWKAEADAADALLARLK